jgi:hypothetical protein
MLIIRGKDYYDGCGYGIDKAFVFKRTNIETDNVKLPFALPKSSYGYVPNIEYKVKGKNERFGGLTYHTFRIRFGYVTVATKCYPFVETHHGFHYSLDEKLMKILSDKKEESIPAITEFLAIDRETYRKYLVYREIVTSVSVAKRFGKGWIQKVNCDGLVDFGLPSVLDAFSCHQEIFQYISGILANNPDIKPLADKDKILKHGFDYVKSFRKEKSK